MVSSISQKIAVNTRIFTIFILFFNFNFAFTVDCRTSKIGKLCIPCSSQEETAKDCAADGYKYSGCYKGLPVAPNALTGGCLNKPALYTLPIEKTIFVGKCSTHEQCIDACLLENYKYASCYNADLYQLTFDGTEPVCACALDLTEYERKELHHFRETGATSEEGIVNELVGDVFGILGK
uniref:Uncharacterized protein n=1 Tax=Panagrolaimus sp. PS1159 TaxID=55785 RepID=A0AC35GAI1_9BILA